jgi:CheY-like chemotaxis protein
LVRILCSLAARVSRSHARQRETLTRVLLVEDHQELAETVSDVLRGEGIAADVARDGQAALDRSTVNCYDVTVLDRDLPGVHGDEVCRALVAGGSQSQVLMLAAAGSIEDRVSGLEALLGDTSEGQKARDGTPGTRGRGAPGEALSVRSPKSAPRPV